MKHLTNALMKPIEAVINKSSALQEVVRLLGETIREIKAVRTEVGEVKAYLARQEEIAREMIEQGNFTDDEEFLVPIDEDIDKKDMN